MEEFRKIFLYLVVLVVSVFGAQHKLPQGLTPCSRSSPDFNECAKEEANKFLPKMVEGIKEIGLPPLNPLTVPKIDITIPGLNLVLTNAEVHGLKDTKVESCKLDFDGHILEVMITIPFGRIVGHYSMDGEIAKIPLTGEGNCNINLTDVNLTYTLKFHTVKHDDGLEYILIDSSDIKHNTPHVEAHLDNLPLGEAGNKLINDNMDEIIKTMGPQVFEACQQVINSILTTVLGHIPYDAMTTD
ncbi:circadian clock-controlled protein daywake-like [Anabrus simplex]|uniref:circadian clock-controlled protein daywake-like n=1 Tax=Anabrus simplex TaxID=316456 RepID=UPI0035A38351